VSLDYGDPELPNVMRNDVPVIASITPTRLAISVNRILLHAAVNFD